MQEYTLLGSKPTRHGFGEALVILGERNENVVVLGGDITGSVMTSMFKDKFILLTFAVLNLGCCS